MLRFDSLHEGFFVSRLNRFVCECLIEGKLVRAHLPNSGRLSELLIEGRKIYAVRKTKKGELPYRIAFVEKEGERILVDTGITNDIANILIERELIPSLRGYHVVRREICVNRRRLDFLLQDGKNNVFLEVKNSTLFYNSLAMFPDCETKRGTSHVEELIKIRDPHVNGGILFVVHSPRVRYFLPDFHNDYTFARTVFEARNSIKVIAVSVEFREDFSLGKTNELLIPWDEMVNIREDSGVYLLLLRVPTGVVLAVGATRKTYFKKGYYVYVGSAMKNLKRRILRHLRQEKRRFWHIDYLTSKFRPFLYLPIRIEKAYECAISRRLLEISDWFVPGFGSSDCTCATHLFGFREDPLKNEGFVDVLLYFRMGIIEERLKTH